MATVTIRKLDEDVKRRIRVRAALHGRSMEAEVREILRGAVGDEPSVLEADAHETVRAVRGRWRGRVATDDIMRLTRGR